MPKNEKLLRKVLKPARYTGGEHNEVIKNPQEAEIRFAFGFPDLYEIGMSNLGMKILYGVLNSLDYVWCERVFAPARDMADEMRKEGVYLYGLESGDEVKNFDFVGFTLQYELSYTNILYMLELAGIPLYSHERIDMEDIPVIIGGGPCSYNPEPVADFFDIFLLGEGEESLPELMELYRECKKKGLTKREFLTKAASKIVSAYVPSFYEVKYKEDGKIESFNAVEKGAPEKIRKRIITDLDKVFFQLKPVIPNIEAVHDRITLEIQRGCIRGCRFCQAGFIYRPLREKRNETLCNDAEIIFENTGYDEISLLSLSSSDYSELFPLANGLISWTDKKHVNIAMPSMRIDSFSKELMEKLSGVRQSTLTFAPEAGSQRMRNVINKNLTEDNIDETLKIAYSSGSDNVKLYFMIGLPGETDEDIVAIAALAKHAVDLYYENKDKKGGRGIKVTISVATFVPKPLTPFQFEPQNEFAEIARKQMLLKDSITSKKVSYNYHDARTSRLEAVFARGDRRLSQAIYTAYKNGALFDGWDEFFKFDIWKSAFDSLGIEMGEYAQRKFSYDDILPWDFIDIGVRKDFFIQEHKNAMAAVTTPNCREDCSFCGASEFLCGNMANGGIKTCCPFE